MRTLLLLALTVLAGCASVAVEAPPSSTARESSAAPRPVPDLVPEPGTAWFGMNLDWANDSIGDVSERLGRTPSVWVQFVEFPLDAGGTANLDAFVEQVAAADGIGLVTLEPHDGLASVTPETAEALARVLDGYWRESGVPTIIRFAHEMNGSWYPWGQQPEAYVEVFRTVADAVHRLAPASAMAWAPNEGAGYPFPAGEFLSDDAALDTDGDGEVTADDDPYAPYWPGADAVDWVGMSLYHWGIEYPWGENEMPPAGSFRALLTGRPIASAEGPSVAPDFYATYAEGHDKPMGVFETAALFNPSEPGPAEAELKTAWWNEVTEASVRADFPRVAMVNWFEWRKHEPEVGGEIDWRLTADPELARALVDGLADGWLLFGGLAGE